MSIRSCIVVKTNTTHFAPCKLFIMEYLHLHDLMILILLVSAEISPFCFQMDDQNLAVCFSLILLLSVWALFACQKQEAEIPPTAPNLRTCLNTQLELH